MVSGEEYASEIRVKVDVYHNDPISMRMVARAVKGTIEATGYIRDGYTEGFDVDSGKYYTTIYFKTLLGG